MSEQEDRSKPTAPHGMPNIGPQKGDARQISMISSVVGALLLIVVVLLMSLGAD